MKKLINPIACSAIAAFVVMIIASPQICSAGAQRGLMLCGRVIIPSLFPFTVCVNFIVNSGILTRFNFAEGFTSRAFHQTTEQFSVMLLSMIGGYPVGAGMINELYLSERISRKNAGIMLLFCINSGPAFTVIAVGGGILNSKNLGYILLASQLLSALLLSLICSRKMTYDNHRSTEKTTLSAVDNFTLAVSGAASSVFGICGYVILFSAINSYVDFWSGKLKSVKYLKYILEVTTAVTSTRNLLLIAFLLGFGGLCVWCQIFSASSGIKINPLFFISARIFHGCTSAAICFALIKIFRMPLPVSGGHTVFVAKAVYDTPELSLSLICMVIILIISLSGKKSSGKWYADLV